MRLLSLLLAFALISVGVSAQTTLVPQVIQNGILNLGTGVTVQAGAVNLSGALARGGNVFTQSYGNVPMQSQFWGYNAGAAYPITADSGFGTIGIGAGALQYQTAAGAETVAVGPLACQFGTALSLTTCVGMHSVGSQQTGAGFTAVGNDAMRDAIGSVGYVTAVGAAAVAHGNPGNVTAVGALSAEGNSTAIVLSGSITIGDSVSVTINASGSSPSGLTGLPVTVTHTVVSGDTLNSIATALANSLNQSVVGPSYELGAVSVSMPDGTAAISLAFPGSATTGWALTTTSNVTGSQTETVSISGGSTINGDFLGEFSGQGQAAQNIIAVTSFGYNSAQYMTTAQYDAFFGNTSAQNITTGNADAFFGALSAQLATTAANDSGLGFWVFQNLTTGNSDTAIGRQACGALTTGSGDFCGGQAVGANVLQTGSGVILLGSGNVAVDTPAANTSNYINIENILTVTGTNAPSDSTTTIAGALVLPSPGTGTAATYACFTSTGQLISSATACP